LEFPPALKIRAENAELKRELVKLDQLVDKLAYRKE
jgi:hypothetical protein